MKTSTSGFGKLAQRVVASAIALTLATQAVPSPFVTQALAEESAAAIESVEEPAPADEAVEEAAPAAEVTEEPATAAEAVEESAPAVEESAPAVEESAEKSDPVAQSAEDPALAVQSADNQLSGDVLDGVTVRFAPQGSTSNLSINEDGDWGQNVIHLYNIGGTSRFYLEKADDESYHIYVYDTFNAPEHRSSGNNILDLDDGNDYEGEGDVVHIVGDDDFDATNKRWIFERQDDGSYYIRNEKSGKYWSLEDTGAISSDNNKLCQRSEPMKWMVEIANPGSKNIDDVKPFDSYTMTHSKGEVSSASWMSALPDDAYLSDLNIPGVHDAGTCGIDPLIEASSYRCQQLYIDDLLNAGVRYFDIRLAMENTSNGHAMLALRHGNDTWGAMCRDRNNVTLMLEIVRQWVCDFLADHPSETVILQLKDETDNNDATKAAYEYFRDLASCNDFIYVGDGAPRLSDVRGKIVLVSRLNLKDAGASDYKLYDGDTCRGSWAIDASWQAGNNYATALAAETDKYQFWTQDNYDVEAGEKWKWIDGSVAGGSGVGAENSAEGRREVAMEYGCDPGVVDPELSKKAWVVNYTSASTVPLGSDPQEIARDINPRLLEQPWLQEDSNTFIGVLCTDFMDARLAYRIYNTNFNRY